MGCPFHQTTAAGAKLLPVRTTWKSPNPAKAVEGDSDAMLGADCALIVNWTTAELAPPLEAFETVTDAVPGVTNSDAGTVAVNEFADT
jgi:hypothetical protein